jgi:tetratricopeptide (TPR) repeat protein
LKKTIDEQKKEYGEAHHIDLFYYAIALLELKRYEEAIIAFDRGLKIYPQFSDAL